MASAVFVYFGCGAVSNPVGGAVPLNYAASFGFAITALAYAIGDVSGGHINAAVTLALRVANQITTEQLLSYWVSQFAGATAGAGLLYATVGEIHYNSGIGFTADKGAGQLFLAEFMGTFFLIFVVINVAVWASNKSSNLNESLVAGIAPLTIGLTILVDHVVLGPISGCGINPSRMIGSVVFEDAKWWDKHGANVWVYIVAPFLAAMVAPLAHMVIYPEGEGRCTGVSGVVQPAEKPAEQPAEAEAEP
jgi:MIP family channel proteins